MRLVLLIVVETVDNNFGKAKQLFSAPSFTESAERLQGIMSIVRDIFRFFLHWNSVALFVKVCQINCQLYSADAKANAERRGKKLFKLHFSTCNWKYMKTASRQPQNSKTLLKHIKDFSSLSLLTFLSLENNQILKYLSSWCWFFSHWHFSWPPN